MKFFGKWSKEKNDFFGLGFGSTDVELLVLLRGEAKVFVLVERNTENIRRLVIVGVTPVPSFND